MLSSLRTQQSTALLVLRLAIAAIFIYHGMLKWQMETPSTLMTILKFVEPLTGATLVVGVLSEIAALALSIVMLGAIYMKMTGFGQAALDITGTFAPQGRTGWEFDLILLAGCLIVLCYGAGKYSVDAAFRK